MQRYWILAFICCAPLTLFASDLARSTAAPSADHENSPRNSAVRVDDHGALEEGMEAIKSSIRSLRRSLKKPEMDAASLATVAKMQVATIRAKGEVPHMTGTLPEQEQPAFVKAYRHEMIRLMRATLTLEAAIVDGEREAIQEAFSALRKLEDPAHERFTEDE